MFITKTKVDTENKVHFKKKTYAELQELLERQNKILNNKRFIDGLPDKGEKVKRFRDQVEVELSKRRDFEKMCGDMSLLGIGQDQLDALEWTGKDTPYTSRESNRPDFDDDNGDVLKIFVSHSGVHQNKIIIEEKIEEPLIKPSDLIDEEATVKDKQLCDENIEFPESVERYAKNLCGRIDTNVPEKMHFLLNKPAKPNKYSIVKSAVVSLKESCMLQHSQESKLKAIQAEKIKRKPIPNYDFLNYRESNIFQFIDNDEDSDGDITDVED